ncbi:hypothetical protein AHAS_Ahas12G0070000 [Arachis hypogaea]
MLITASIDSEAWRGKRNFGIQVGLEGMEFFRSEPGYLSSTHKNNYVFLLKVPSSSSYSNGVGDAYGPCAETSIDCWYTSHSHRFNPNSQTQLPPYNLVGFC